MTYASLLCEVQSEDGDEKSDRCHDEEWQASDEWDLRDLRHENVPNRQRKEIAERH